MATSVTRTVTAKHFGAPINGRPVSVAAQGANAGLLTCTPSSGTTGGVDGSGNPLGRFASTIALAAGAQPVSSPVVVRFTVDGVQTDCAVSIVAPGVVVPPPPPPPPATGGADPSLLPTAARQVIDWAAVHASGIATAPAGTLITDQIAGTVSNKLTTAAFAGGNASMSTDYSSGAEQISQSHGGKRTHLLRVPASGAARLLDEDETTRALSNERALPDAFADLSFTFSDDPAEPTIAYYVSGAKIKRYDFVLMAEAPNARFPAGGWDDTAHLGGGFSFTWIHRHKRRTVHVTQPTAGITQAVVWRDEATNTIKTLHDADIPLPADHVAGDTYTINDPRFDSGGEWVAVSIDRTRGGVAREDLFSLMLWNPVTDVKTPPLARSTHFEMCAGFAVSNDPDTQFDYEYRIDPTTQAVVNTGLTAATLSDGAGHRSGNQWAQPSPVGGPLKARYLVSRYDDGKLNGTTVYNWAAQGSGVYSTAVVFNYRQATHDGRQVYQTNNPQTKYTKTLTRYGSLAALQAAADGFFWPAGATVYVKIAGGGSPAGLVDVRAPNAVHDFLAFVTLDGAEVKLLTHVRSVHLTGLDYWRVPKATLSADGKWCIYTSNSGLSDGRCDVFSVKVPVGA